MTFSIQGSEILFIVLWCLQFLLCIACAIVIVLFRNNQSMRARAPVLSSLSSIGAATYLGAYTLSYSIPGTPCSLIVLVANVSFYVLWAPLLLRAWRIYFIYHWNSKMIAEQKKQEEISKERRNARNLNKKLQNKAKGETAEDGLGDNPPPQQPQKPSTSTRGWRHNNQDDLQTDQISVLDVEDVPTLMDATEVSEMMRKQKATNTSNVNKRRAEESNLVKFFVIMLIVVVVLMLPVSLAYPGLCPHDFLCQINERETNNPIMTFILYPRLVVPLMFIVDIMLLIEVIMLREVNDSYSLNTEIRVATVISIIGTIFLAVLSFTNLSFAFVVMAQIWVQAIHCTCSYYPVILLAYNALRKKTGMSMSELGKMEIPNSIEKMLENDVTRELFKRYLLKALCSETILFYEQVLSYKKATADERSQMAPNIIENYIKDDALNEINIAGKVKKRIIHRYNQITYDDEVPIDLFDIAIEKLKLVLNENGTYQNFLESSEFKQYVKKVKNNKKIKEIEVAGGI